jgi:hypothetical protein
VAAVILFTIIHISDVISSFGSHAVGACILLVVASSVLGYLFGGKNQLHRGDMMLGTGYRGINAALAVGIRNFPGNQNILTVAIIMVLASVLILFPVASIWLRAKNQKARQLVSVPRS